MQARAGEELDMIIDRYWVDEHGYLACCGRLLSLIVDLLACQDDSASEAHSTTGLVRSADRIMRRRFRHGCTVAEVAQALGYSRQHFSLRYHQACGFGPGEFLDRLQLHEACQQLRATDAPVADVARRSGMRSAATLTARMRRAFGKTPAQWRRSLRADGRQGPAAASASGLPAAGEGRRHRR